MTLTVAILFVVFGSSVSAMVAAFAVIEAPVAAVTFTIRRSVHVVFGAMLPFSWQTILARSSGYRFPPRASRVY